jgi:plastocyanin
MMPNGSRTKGHRPFHFIVATLALIAAARAQADIASPPSSALQPTEIKIVTTEFKFDPAKFWVVAGRKVTLVLDNSTAETEHGIFIPAFGFHLAAMAGEVARKTAVFDKPGEYEFSCDLPGHREMGMKGVMVVIRF